MLLFITSINYNNSRSETRKVESRCSQRFKYAGFVLVCLVYLGWKYPLTVIPAEPSGPCGPAVPGLPLGPSFPLIPLGPGNPGAPWRNKETLTTNRTHSTRRYTHAIQGRTHTHTSESTQLPKHTQAHTRTNTITRTHFMHVRFMQCHAYVW